MIFNCEKCGNVSQMSVDGYAAGDRLLEGVMFRVKIQADGSLTCAVEPEYKKYFSQLNVEKWLAEVVQDVKDNCGDVRGSCVKCGGDIFVDE